MPYKIHRSGQFESYVEQESGFIGKIADLNQMELAQIAIKAGKELVLLATDDLQHEFYYILKGQIKLTADGTLLGVHDALHVEGDMTPLYCEVMEDTLILYISQETTLKQTMDSMHLLNELVNALEEKDNYTKQHSGRVMEIAPLIANKMNLSEHQVETLLSAAIYHDIGKIKIDQHILLKPGRLTDEEYDHIKHHPTYGKELLMKHGLKDVAEVIEMHHERMDGTGYPHGLEGEDIRIEARIISVIDSYDAMTSDRPYKKGRACEEALKEIESLAGILYDEEVVKVFLQVMRDEV